jgi:hypothetical protein
MFILNFCPFFPSGHVHIVCETCMILITPTNQNSIREEIKSRLNSGNACYHLVQNLSSSSVLTKNIKIKTYRTLILPVVWYGCVTRSLTLREEHGIRVSENRVLRRILGQMRIGNREWKKLHNEELNDLYPSHNIVRVIKSRRMRWAGHVARMGERRGVYRCIQNFGWESWGKENTWKNQAWMGG